MRTRVLIAVGCCLAAVCSASRAGNDDPVVDVAAERQEPIDVDLVERAERRLFQLDVSVRPKKKTVEDSIPDLAPGDFEVVVNGEIVPLEYADRVCRRVEAPVAEPAERPGSAQQRTEPEATPARPEPAPHASGTYVFYLEHKHLTMQGQDTALTMAREMIPKLVGGGNRGMVVSSGAKLLRSPVTDEPGRLLEFIEGVRKNVGQWSESSYAELERDRYATAMNLLMGGGGLGQVKLRLKFYIREESANTRRQLQRFDATLRTMAGLDPPKAVIYFADIIRRHPGRHYASLVPWTPTERGKVRNLTDGVFGFDRVTEAAGAHGVRLYTVQAQGLQTESLGVNQSRQRTLDAHAVPDLPSTRIKDAVETMRDFALESGGAMFFGGAEASTMNRIVGRIRSDLACFYLLSFGTERLSEDRKLSVRVRFNPDSNRYDELERQYEVSTRGQIVVQSESRRTESLLLASHVTSGDEDSEPGRSAIIPLGFEDGRFLAMVQLGVGGPGLPGLAAQPASWDLGMTHLRGDTVEHQADRRVDVSDARVPIVLQAAWAFEPGRNEIVSIGYENRLGRIVTARAEIDWPDPNGAHAVVTPIEVVQPQSAVFVEGTEEEAGEARENGPVGLGGDSALVDRPTYLVGLVCRGRHARQPLWIHRRLVGNVSIDFDSQRWDFDERERCIQIRDLIRENQVGWGDFRYEVRVSTDIDPDSEPLAERTREFTAADR